MNNVQKLPKATFFICWITLHFGGGGGGEFQIAAIT